MKIEILCEGKIKKNQANVLCNDYCLRISKLKHSGVSELKINELTDKKKKKIQKKKHPLYILSQTGKLVSTEDLLNLIRENIMRSKKNIFFAIGNANGFNSNYEEYINLSLGKVTFTHALTRLIFCEQIYRCVTRLINHPYHKN